MTEKLSDRLIEAIERAEGIDDCLREVKELEDAFLKYQEAGQLLAEQVVTLEKKLKIAENIMIDCNSFDSYRQALREARIYLDEDDEI